MTTHEQIIAAAKNSRLEALFIKDANGKVWRVIDLALPELERFYAIAFEAGRKAEREDCAKACEEIRVIVDGNHQWTALHVQDQCIKAIRKRSTK